MRLNRANSSGDRSNALWGRGSRGEARSNALWGRGGRRAGAAVLTAVACFTLAAAVAVAAPGNRGARGNHSGLKAYVEDSLLAAVQQNPKQSFSVIVQGSKDQRTAGLVSRILGNGGSSVGFGAGNVRRQFNAIDGFQGNLTGNQILFLAKTGLASSIFANEAVEQSAVQLPLYNTQLWPWTTGAPV